jgi:glycosyltransferase involved in cell wall biosynthesis
MSRPTNDAERPTSCEVTVVIAAYNRAQLLRRAIASVHRQTVSPAEVIVVDDNSSDSTAEVAAEMGALVLRHKANQGPAAARNTALQAASQPWIAVLDSDDEWLPHHLATLWPARHGHDLVAAPALAVGGPGTSHRLSGWPGRHELLLRSPAQLLYPENPVSSTALLRRAAVARAGGYDEAIWFVEDLDLYARILEQGTGVIVPTVTCLYHHGASQATDDIQFMLGQRTGLAERFAQRPWSDRKLIERMRAVTAWDQLRLAIAERSWRSGLEPARWLAAHPFALRALLGLWSWRYRVRHAAVPAAILGDSSSAVSPPRGTGVAR